MKRHAPQVGDYMTHLPVEAEKCENVAEALNLMNENKIHHLPVMNGSHFKGLVSLRDILLARAGAANGIDELPLEDICQTDVLKVRPVTPLDEVAREFLRRETDSAVVMDGGFVVGIFTTTDAMRFIGDFFGQTKERG